MKYADHCVVIHLSIFFMATSLVLEQSYPRWQCLWGHNGAHFGPTGPRWAPCWPHEHCYLGPLSQWHQEIVDQWSTGIMPRLQKFEWPMWPWPLIYWTGNDTWHISPSRIVFVPNMNIIHEIGNETHNRWHAGKMDSPMDRWSKKFPPNNFVAWEV